VPRLWVPRPKGIREPQRWYEKLAEKPDYAREILAIQTETGLENLMLYGQASGDKIEVIVMSGTDFGSQRGPLCQTRFTRTSWPASEASPAMAL
jgi:hypothetical protein